MDYFFGASVLLCLLALIELDFSALICWIAPLLEVLCSGARSEGMGGWTAALLEVLCSGARSEGMGGWTAALLEVGGWTAAFFLLTVMS